MTTITNQTGFITTQTFGPVGMLVSKLSPNGYLTTMTYDEAANPMVENGNGSLSTTVYSGSNSELNIHYPNGAISTYAYAGGGKPGDISCTVISASRSVAKCVCALSAKAASGVDVCGSTWIDNDTCHTYNFITHNCQDYTICLLHSFGVGSSWTDCYLNRGWENGQQGWPYFPPVARLPSLE